jgi:hypothetical protein
MSSLVTPQVRKAEELPGLKRDHFQVLAANSFELPGLMAFDPLQIWSES